MLSAQDPVYWHVGQGLSLIALSVFFLPMSVTIVIWTFIFSIIFHQKSRELALHRERKRLRGFAGLAGQTSWMDGEQSPPMTPPAEVSLRGRSKEKAILVTGVSMTKGLTLARLLAKYTSYRIIGADTSPLAHGRFSRFVDDFVVLAPPSEDSEDGNAAYKKSLISFIEKENVGLWVSCSGVMSAVEDAEVREELDKIGKCKSIQFGVKQTRMLHEKEKFGDWLRDNGFLTPETITITSHEAVMERLYPSNGEKSGPAGGKKYILKPTGVIDAQRADMTLLPLSTRNATHQHIMKKPISKKSSWILQEFIQGREYCTHALIVKGQVRNFVACPSAELLMHYEALPTDGRLSKAMLKFTQKVAAMLEQEEIDRSRGAHGQRADDSDSTPGHFTGHLSFDFFVKDDDLNDESREVRLYPIECNPRAHTAVALFRNTPESITGYVEVLQEKPIHHTSYRDAVALGISEAEKTPGSDTSLLRNEGQRIVPVYPVNPQSAYWIAHDLIELLIIPILHLITLRTSPVVVIKQILAFLTHVLFWREASFDVDDPVPSLVLYHVFWPFMFAQSLWKGHKWSRANVSTGKMFGLE